MRERDPSSRYPRSRQAGSLWTWRWLHQKGLMRSDGTANVLKARQRVAALGGTRGAASQRAVSLSVEAPQLTQAAALQVYRQDDPGHLSSPLLQAPRIGAFPATPTHHHRRKGPAGGGLCASSKGRREIRRRIACPRDRRGERVSGASRSSNCGRSNTRND